MSQAAAEYRVLARKYRPSNFDDLIGQDALVRTLSNAMRTNRIAHAFLLTGIRGIGKTTTARIIARALNCVGEDGQGDATIHPCGVCSNCTMIAQDRHVDVVEMDAASHTGVDDIREIIESVRYMPSSARYKIYIIDEVHMLSKNAFNALLKTLEEPPPHVKFIFATTEVRKIPVTILSRCQRFDLRRIDNEMLAKHLGKITQKESVEIEPEALTLLAVAAEGSVRDALSLLDQAIAHSSNAQGTPMITADMVRHMIGSANKTATFQLLDVLLSGDSAKAIEEIRKQYTDGGDPMHMLQNCLEVVHLITRIKVSPAALEDVSITQGDRDTAKTMAKKLAMPTLTRLWQMLLKGTSELRMAPMPLAALEMLMVRVCYAASLPTPAEVIKLEASQAPPQPVLQPSASHTPAVHAEDEKKNTTQQLIETAPPHALPSDSAQETPEKPVTLATINNFEDLTALFEQKREGVIHAVLVHNVHFVAFKSGELTLRLASGAPRNLPQQMMACLKEWTGQNWKILTSDEQGSPTLHEQADTRKKLAMQSAASDPLVQSILAHFPGAEMTSIIENVTTQRSDEHEPAENDETSTRNANQDARSAVAS